jgi:hypothetical protein
MLQIGNKKSLFCRSQAVITQRHFGLSMVAPGASCGTAMETPERKPPELPQLWATVAPN